MSTLVIVRKNDRAVIAADTLTRFGDVKCVQEDRRNPTSKIFQFNDNYIGTIGSSVHQDVLVHVLEKYADEVSFENREAIFNTYLKLHPILKNEYFLNPGPEKDDEYETSQIEAFIANPRGIFAMFSWRGVVEYERFYATGSGRDFALGAMHTVYDSCTAEQIAIAGVTAACKFDISSELPYVVESCLIDKSGDKPEGLKAKVRAAMRY
jgi:ATP-dependent protease HslVU (ClpYQ) peptidase subunit